MAALSLFLRSPQQAAGVKAAAGCTRSKQDSKGEVPQRAASMSSNIFPM